jgi:peptidoglycan/LPS O-acetylase OafA/YrhL
VREGAASIPARVAARAVSHARPVLAHRADIDGLRALAVVPVLLFHAGFPAFPGGFVGVDVFFVISGYLITSIILDDIERGRFSVLAFYERRIRRIFPALFATLLGSLILGTFVLLPNDLKDLGQSVTAATLFASNILFWRESGYFDAPAEHNALLHTWSLAVEEQFYIVFPLVLLFFRTRSNYLLYIAAALLVSFALALWGVRNAPVTTFYLAPARAWELLMGALLATGAIPPPSRQGLRDALSLLGVGLIACSVLAFSPETPFPGAAALPPCLGAGLVIYAGAGGRSLAGRILGAPALAFTGLISYSLYLWHWPLLVLARVYAVRELTVPETIAVLLLSAAIAALSWRWVESPFRRKPPVLGRQQLFAAAGLVMGVTAALGVGLHLTRGLPQRLPPEAARLAAGASDRNQDRGLCLNEPLQLVQDGRLCRIGAGGEARPTFILWGDSHAEMLRTGLGKVATEAGRTGFFAGYPGCPPLLGVSVGRSDAAVARACRAFNEAVLDLVSRDDGIRTVVLAAHWSLYATGVRYGRKGGRVRLLGDDRTEPGSARANEAVLRRGLVRTAAALAGAGKEVVIVGPVPEVGSPVPRTLALAVWRGRNLDIRPARDGFNARHHIVLSALTGIGQRELARVVYPHLALCDEARCRIESNGRALYSDDNHLTRYGADSIGHIFEPVL